MQSRKIVFSALAVLVIGVGWYLFRPERLWVNKAVNESLDQATARRGIFEFRQERGHRRRMRSGLQTQ